MIKMMPNRTLLRNTRWALVRATRIWHTASLPWNWQEEMSSSSNSARHWCDVRLLPPTNDKHVLSKRNAWRQHLIAKSCAGMARQSRSADNDDVDSDTNNNEAACWWSPSRFGMWRVSSPRTNPRQGNDNNTLLRVQFVLTSPVVSSYPFCPLFKTT